MGQIPPTAQTLQVCSHTEVEPSYYPSCSDPSMLARLLLVFNELNILISTTNGQ